MEKPKKKRLQFDLTPEKVKNLDELKERAGLPTRAKLFRNSLRLYEWYLREIKENGGELYIEKNGKREKVYFFMT